MRMILGVVVGLVAQFLSTWVIQAIGHRLVPVPGGVDFSTPAAIERTMAALPPAAFGFVLASWFIGALLGCWLADAIAKRALAGWIIAGLVVAAVIANLVMIPHPAWMWIGVALPPIAALIARRLARVPA
jgi:hypothetical protein